jgi:hypothetical protein
VDHINKGDSGGADEFFTPEMEHKFRTASYWEVSWRLPRLDTVAEMGGLYTC